MISAHVQQLSCSFPLQSFEKAIMTDHTYLDGVMSPEENYAIGFKHFHLENYEEAKKFCQKAADNGHSEAFVLLGYLYYSGRGVFRDLDQAFACLKQAAERNSARAFELLGSLYEFGDGCPQNSTLAEEFYKKAVELGSARAAYALGSMHYSARGVPRDFEKAWMWLQVARKMGCISAICQMARLNIKGQGIPTPNLARANELLQIASSLGSKAAKRSLHIGASSALEATQLLELAGIPSLSTVGDKQRINFFLQRKVALHNFDFSCDIDFFEWPNID